MKSLPLFLRVDEQLGGHGQPVEIPIGALRSKGFSLESTTATKSRSLPTPQSPRANEPKQPSLTSSGCRAAAVDAQAGSTPATSARLGHANTDELKDLTGIVHRFTALERTVVLKWGAFRMPVGVTRGNVKVVQHPAFFHKVLVHCERQF